jgi:hypothetical protein
VIWWPSGTHITRLTSPLGHYSSRLAAGHHISHLSIFDLPSRAWDLGSMFFVADGITSDVAEFEAAVRSFLGSLTPGRRS